jgi:hypothetical protein
LPYYGSIQYKVDHPADQLIGFDSSYHINNDLVTSISKRFDKEIIFTVPSINERFVLFEIIAVEDKLDYLGELE